MDRATQILARLQRYETWLQENGGYIHPDVELVHSDTNGIHLRVKEALRTAEARRQGRIPRGTTIAACPHSLSLSALNAIALPPIFPRDGIAGSTSNEANQPFLEFALNSHWRLASIGAMWLCIQVLLEDRSPWRPYINCLPGVPNYSQFCETAQIDTIMGEVHTPMWWSVEEREWIVETNLGKKVESAEKTWIAGWEECRGIVEDVVGGGGVTIDWHLFKWAMTIISTRAFDSSVLSEVALVDVTDGSNAPLLERCDPVMILYPLVDCFNHKPTTRNLWTSDGRVFNVICNDEPRPGDEIFLMYDTHDNAELLVSYGFAIPRNPHESISMEIPEVFASFLEQFLAILPTYKIQPSKTELHLPPAYELSKNCFYVRDLQLPSMLNSQYPVHDPNSIVASAFAAFPVALLSSCSLKVASRRENVIFDDLINRARNSSTSAAEPDPQNVYILACVLGVRNVLAVAAALHERLQGYLSGLLDAAPKEPIFIERLGRPLQGSLEVEADNSLDLWVPRASYERRQRNWCNLQTCREGGETILRRAMAPVEALMSRALHSTRPPQALPTGLAPGWNIPQPRPQPHGVGIFTLEKVISLFSAFTSPELQHLGTTFTDILLRVFGTTDLLSFRLNRTERHVWALWVAFLDMELHAKLTTSPDSLQWHDPTAAMLKRWIDTMRDAYTDISGPPPASRRVDDNELELQHAAMARQLLEVVEVGLREVRVETVDFSGDRRGGGVGVDGMLAHVGAAVDVAGGWWTRERMMFAVRVVEEERLSLGAGLLESVPEEVARWEGTEARWRPAVVMVLN